MKSKQTLAILLAIGVFFLGFQSTIVSASVKVDNKDRKVMLGINSNGKKIELKVGDEIHSELEGAGATGYWWYFDKLDHSFFEFVGEETKPIGREGKKMAGEPVIGVWKLRARRPGRSIIRMKYYRAWEKSEKAINQFEVSVDINP